MLTAEAIRYYKDKPVEFTKDIIKATPDQIQGDILTSVAENSLTSVRSGHGIGKSALQSWLILWFMCTRPFPKIPCTAPTKHQLHDILWAEVAKWIWTEHLKQFINDDELIVWDPSGGWAGRLVGFLSASSNKIFQDI